MKVKNRAIIPINSKKGRRKMPSIHKVPFCMAKNRYEQDKLRDSPIKCPGCGLTITNLDVTDCVQLVDLISLIRSSRGESAPIWRA
jgi:hypothetical protein